jgi:DNA replication and repair protein RecF
LNAALAAGAAGAFPPARIDLLDPVAARLDGEPALAVEDWLRTALAGARGRDSAAGSASLGAHRADMVLSDAQTGLSAQLASTGQQKALLVGTILGHAALIAEARGTPPMLLLDEPLVHLDSERRQALLQALARLSATTLMTGTDAAAFSPLQGVAEALQTGGDALKPDPSFPPASPV